MSLSFIIILFVLGFVGSFLSGMLGVGGAIINYPLILYIPPLLGVAALTAHHVSGVVAVQVFFATLCGVFAYRKGGYLNKGLILYMGISILAGSLIGGYSSEWISENVVNFIYGILAILAVILMFIPRRDAVQPDQSLQYNRLLAMVLSFIVGICAGIVGAGGSFLLVPIMLTVLNIPMRVTIATSLAVTFISSIGSVTGKLLSHQILFWPSLIVVIASIIASPIGAKLGQKVNPKVLKVILLVLIIATTIKIWMGIL
ncbi:sulfite exporter TauE/SafE family protein [Scopulibacillus cellulosilyticus]|uniref:Probable membrane transporter protein n=1 Tax=Scopulibacillus cellulosilyticus TaxID=2665665 RepID=A0ABW2PXK0_9BACL